MIIDAHLHVTWGFHGLTIDGPTKSLPYGRAQVGDEKIQVLPPLCKEPTRFEPETLIRLMDLTGITQAVLLQGSFYGDQNEYLYETVQNWPKRFVAAAYLDPRDTEVRETFRQVTDDFGFKILKFEMSEATGFSGIYPDLRLDGPEMQWIWEAAAERDLVITLDLGRGKTPGYQTEAVRKIIDWHPNLRIVIPHLAQPPICDINNEELNTLWEAQILLGQHENLWFDTAALPAYGAQEYPYAPSKHYIRRATELIGPTKLMWGSDIPGLLGQATYPQLLASVRKHAGFSDTELTAILAGTAQQVYFQK
jgi:predicted TIM-barrel fold metal-dependent hydrolase